MPRAANSTAICWRMTRRLVSGRPRAEATSAAVNTRVSSDDSWLAYRSTSQLTTSAKAASESAELAAPGTRSKKSRPEATRISGPIVSASAGTRPAMPRASAPWQPWHRSTKFCCGVGSGAALGAVAAGSSSSRPSQVLTAQTRQLPRPDGAVRRRRTMPLRVRELRRPP